MLNTSIYIIKYFSWTPLTVMSNFVTGFSHFKRVFNEFAKNIENLQKSVIK